MEMLFPLYVIALVFIGIWGSMYVFAKVKQMTPGDAPDDEALLDLRDTTRLLEARLERVEEELSFFRELYPTERAKELPSSSEHRIDPDREPS